MAGIGEDVTWACLTLQIRSGQVLMEEIRIQGTRLLHLDVRHQKGSPSQLSVDPKKVDAD